MYITGHIPPNEAMIEWSLRYNALVDRFNYVIRGQFYGHTHNDHLAFFSPLNDTTESIHNSYFVAPSLTTYSNKNPRYRIMKVDLDTMRVVDYDQFS